MDTIKNCSAAICAEFERDVRKDRGVISLQS